MVELVRVGIPGCLVKILDYYLLAGNNQALNFPMLQA
jgi:hypothetical protein